MSYGISLEFLLMSILPESQSGIWMNTPVKFLGIQSESVLGLAQNDSNWRFFANDFNPISELADATESHLHQNLCRTLYTRVKFKVTTEIVSDYYFKHQTVEPDATLTTLDIGCSLQMLRRHLNKSIGDLQYIGVDSLPMTYPDMLCDVSNTAVSQAFKSVKPDVVIALDLLPTLHDTKIELTATLSRWLRALDEKPGLYVFTLPVCYESDQHLLKLNNEQWLELLNETFIVEDIQAIGFLSALPYWIGKRLPRASNGMLQRSQNSLKISLYDSNFLQIIESILTGAFKRTKMLRRYSHSVVVTARPRPVS
jgi:hypothetical protein